MKTLSGVWRLNDQFTIPVGFRVEQDVNFTVYTTPPSDSVEYLFACSGMVIHRNPESAGSGSYYLEYRVECTIPDDWFHGQVTFPTLFQVYDQYGWDDTNSFGDGVKFVNFGTAPQSVSDEFYDVFTGNATQLAVTISYKGEVLESLLSGENVIVHTKGKLMEEDFQVTIPPRFGGGSGGAIVQDSPLPIEIATEAAMTALLETAAVGSVYKYTGPSGTYENGALYVVAAE